jgi:uncharacterized protein YbjT (DUF2867 family)
VSGADGTILVTGASGKTGSLVAGGLRALAREVRTAARSGADVVFDWQAPETYDHALRGVARAYLVAPPVDGDPSAVMTPFLERALAAGVRRFVLLSSSALTATDAGLGTVERFLRERAPEHTIVKPSWFMQNFAGRWHPHGKSLLDEGVMLTSTGSGRVPFVDVADIAAVVVRALADDRAHDTAHLVTGPAALSYADVAAILSRATGRPLRHVSIDDAEARDRLLGAGLPPAFADLLVALDARIRDGAEDRVTDTVLRVTGRPPRTFEAFAASIAPSLLRGV